MIKYWLRPVNFHSRDREFYKKIREKQTITSHDLVAVDYGEFPIKGLADKDLNHRPVEVRSIWEDKNSGFFNNEIFKRMHNKTAGHYLRLANRYLGKVFMSVATAGYVHGKPIMAKNNGIEQDESSPQHDRAIYMNQLLFSPFGQFGLGYIAFTLGTRLAVAATALNVGKVVAASPILVGMALLSTLRFSVLTQLLSLPFRATMDTVGHEHVHVMQVHDEHERKTGFEATRDIFRARDTEALKSSALLRTLHGVNNFASFGIVHYLRGDAEIQARMHTALVHGYKRWGRLPETKMEFWAAMVDCGLHAPKAIHKALKESKEEGVKDFYKPGLKTSFNRVARNLCHAEIAELNAAHGGLFTKTLKTRHWEQTLPFLYGHLRELYGDSEGRHKMGFDGKLDANTGDPLPYVKPQKPEAPAPKAG